MSDINATKVLLIKMAQTVVLITRQLTATILICGTVWCCAVTAQNNTTHNLSSLYQLALENDQKLQIAQKAFETSQTRQSIARSELLPQINLSISRNRIVRQKIDGTFFSRAGPDDSGRYDDYSTKGLRLDLRQTLFNTEQFIALSQSRSQAKAAHLEYQSAQQDLILRLAQAYFAVLSAQSRLKFANSEKEASAHQRDQAQSRFDVGLVTVTDVAEAQAAYDIAGANEIAAVNSLSNALYALTAIVNVDVKQLMQVNDKMAIHPPVPENMSQWVEKALIGNLDLLAKNIRVNIAKQEIRRQRSGHLPTVDLVASRREEDTQGGPSPRDSTNESIGIEFAVPLLAGGRTYYQTKQATQRHQQEVHELYQLQREVTFLAQEAYLNVITAMNRTRALAKAIESAQTAVAANQAGFTAGTRTSADVLLVLRDLFNAEFDYAELRNDYIVNMLRLKKAIGALSRKDVNQINSWLTIPS